MRAFILLIALGLLPVMIGVHAWQFLQHRQPAFEVAALALLQREGVLNPAAQVQFLDLHVTGEASNAEIFEKVTAALHQLSPLRLVSNEISIQSTLRARISKQEVVLDGWLPDTQSLVRVTSRLTAIRPDLRVDSSGVKVSSQARWPQGVDDPLADDGPLLAHLIERLRVEPSLRAETKGRTIVVSGALPSEQEKEAVVRTISAAAPGYTLDSRALIISQHAASTPFARDGALLPFLRSFFGSPAPGDFSIGSGEGPRLRAPATPSQESEWLGLLRPVTGGAKVEADLRIYPSVYHFPEYRPISQLPANQIEEIHQALTEFYVAFDAGKAGLPQAAQARLAGLSSTFLAAGPALRLIIGGHPDPGGDPAAQRKLALARAESVRAFLIEQGAPAAEMEAVAFDPIAQGSPGAPIQPRSVEVLIK